MSKIELRGRGLGAGAGAGVGAGFAARAGAGFGSGLFFSLPVMMRCASVPAFAYAGKSHQEHAALSVPFSAALTGICSPQQRHAMVPM